MPRCSRRTKSSAPCKAARPRSAKSCWPISRTRTRSTAPTACPSWPRRTPIPSACMTRKSPCWKAAQRPGHEAALHRAMAPTRHLHQEGDRLGGRPAWHKWRAYSPATAKVAELIGAQPVTIQAAELSQALATGVIESYMSSGSTGYDSKTYESLKYWYDTQAWLPKDAIIVNKKSFDALDPATQAAVTKAAAEAETRGWALSQEKNDWYKKALAEKGMKIMPPPAKLTADLKQVGDIMLSDWIKKAGPDGEAIIAAYRKSAPAAKK